jgi:phytoene dehydrogenase-like protein
MAARYDAIIIGGGHNGLVCAAYLSRARRKVLVLEAADRLGGAAATREFAPGFRVSACAHILGQFQGGIVADLDLVRHGLAFAARDMATTALSLDAPSLTISPSGVAAQSSADAKALAAFQARLGRLAQALSPILGMIPPRLGTSDWADRRRLLRLAWQVRTLGRTEMRELLRIIGMNAYDLLEDAFETDLLKGALALDATLGVNFGPRSPGTVLTLLYRMAAEAGARNGLAQPIGGMGAVADAIAASARVSGAEIRTGAPVARILVERDQAAGVTLDSGETIRAAAVISSADPRTTFLKLLGAEHLDTGFVRRVDHFRHKGLAAKLHLALNVQPAFTGVDPAALTGRLVVAPTLNYIEHAYNHAKYGEYSSAPALEIIIPTVNDPALAPPGKHVLSAVVQYAPYDLAGGWPAARERFADIVVQTIAAHAPGLERTIIARELLTPVDIEREFRIAGGHWHHGDLAFDQFLMVRPFPGAPQYRAPVEGLYLCGAGSHPGGGVMGVAGRNAARQVLSSPT